MARPTSMRRKARYHEIDEWRGYRIPPGAVAGASDCGEWYDSPCPSHAVKVELNLLKSHLRHHGLHPRDGNSDSSNMFMVKRWIVVRSDEFSQAARLTLQWLEENKETTRYVHGADLEDLGFKVT